jgi:hypothetical protein
MTRTAIDHGQLKNKPSYLAGANEGADHQHSEVSWRRGCTSSSEYNDALVSPLPLPLRLIRGDAVCPHFVIPKLFCDAASRSHISLWCPSATLTARAQVCHAVGML